MHEEDFASAAQYKAEAEQLEARLPANKLLLCTRLARLEGGASGSSSGGGSSASSSSRGGSLQDKKSVVQQLGDLGDKDAAAALAACLHEVEEGLAAAAEDSLWQVFMRCAGTLKGFAVEIGYLWERRWPAGCHLLRLKPIAIQHPHGHPHLHPQPCLPCRPCCRTCPAAPAAAPSCRCPTPALDEQMQQGMVLMRRPEQWGQAHQLFTEMIAQAPEFAEV